MPSKTKTSVFFGEVYQNPEYLQHNIHYVQDTIQITGHMKKMENVIHIQEKRQSTQMLELTSKDFKAAILTLLNDIKENIFLMNENTENQSRRKESIKRYQMETLGLKITTC